MALISSTNPKIALFLEIIYSVYGSSRMTKHYFYRIIVGIILGLAILITAVGAPPICGSFPNVSFPVPTGGVDTLSFNAYGTPVSSNPLDKAFLAGTFSNLPSGYDLENDITYPEWCIDLTNNIQTGDNDVISIQSAYDPISSNISTKYNSVNFSNLPKINYIISKKWYWYNNGATSQAIQFAIWNLTDGYIPGSSNYHGTKPNPNPTQVNYANQIIADANANGTSYVPGCGDPVLILIELDNIGIKEDPSQLTVVELNRPLGNLTGWKRNSSGTGLSGWTIVLNNTTTGYWSSVVTNATGGFSFSNIPFGIYYLGEVGQTGWTQITPNRSVEINSTCLQLLNQNFTNDQQFGNISGYKNNSMTGAGIGNWVITLTNVTTGTPGYTNTTDSTGAYSFANLPLGTYYLNETPVYGWTQSTSTPNRTITIDGSHLTFTLQNFTNTQQFGAISGYKNNSATGAAIPGWTIVLNNTTTGYWNSTVTNGTGAFSFTNIPYGIYTLGEVGQAGWVQNSSTPNRTITIDGAHQTLTLQNFTNTQQFGNISGYKNSTVSSAGIPGWRIMLTNVTTGIPTYSTTTDSSGAFKFTNLPWGMYYLNETMQPGWTQSSGTPNRTITIDGTHLTFTVQNFSNTQQLGAISGYKNNSVTGAGIPNWVITLANKTTGAPAYSTTTSASGAFSFSNLPWGTYWLNETMQSGWTQSSGTPNRTITIDGTHLTFNLQNFTNKQNDVKWSGRGTICTSQGNYIFQMQTVNGVTTGTITFIDFKGGKTISGIANTLVTSSPNTATFSGTATVNGVPGYTFSVDIQRNPAYLFIRIPGQSYSSGGNICSGNIDP